MSEEDLQASGHPGCECCIQSDKRWRRAKQAEEREYELLQKLAQSSERVASLEAALKQIEVGHYAHIPLGVQDLRRIAQEALKGSDQ